MVGNHTGDGQARIAIEAAPRNRASCAAGSGLNLAGIGLPPSQSAARYSQPERWNRPSGRLLNVSLSVTSAERNLIFDARRETPGRLSHVIGRSRSSLQPLRVHNSTKTDARFVDYSLWRLGTYFPSGRPFFNQAQQIRRKPNKGTMCRKGTLRAVARRIRVSETVGLRHNPTVSG